MTAPPAGVVIAAGGLGTRVTGWTPFLPKEFRPVAGRPGLAHVLEETAVLGAERAVVVHHPYYAPLITWVRQAFAPGALARYQEVARQPVGPRPPAEMIRVDFIPQHGPYSDITSALNGSEHLGTADICLVYSDNVDPTHGALSALAAASTPGTPAVLAAPFDLRAASSHGVIVCSGTGPVRTMTALVEKPGPARAAQLAREHGPDALRLLQGRLRLTPDLLHHLTAAARRTAAEPKLSLALAAYARRRRVDVVTNAEHPLTDLGSGFLPGEAFRL
ncbi:sugar phosphate nucleotidyltransferase [Streptomyces sp. NPDC059142]|uniref:sugar phosphate nucleotidyltransferase n=1 Tax=Streptomyces sp. NPDC059142 TaxID=3346739 RepID=UPI0036A03284